MSLGFYLGFEIGLGVCVAVATSLVLADLTCAIGKWIITRFAGRKS